MLLAFEHDLKAGQPAPILAAAHAPKLLPWSADVLARHIEWLHRAGIGKFRALNDMAITELATPTVPGQAHQMIPDGDGWRGIGSDPYLVFTLRAQQPVLAVRLRYHLDNGGQPAQSQAYWRDSGRGQAYAEDCRTRHFTLETGPAGGTAVIPINDTIDEFRLDPDERPCRFHLDGLWLFLPAGADQAVTHALPAVPSSPTQVPRHPG
jgi:hypothetical protein